VVVASSTTSAGIASAINNVAGFTGVFASGGGTNLTLRSEEFGEDSLIKMQVIGGSLFSTGFERVDESTAAGAWASFGISGTSLGSTQILTDRGRDGQVSFEGQLFTGVGNDFSILSTSAQFEFELNPDNLTSDAGGIVGVLGGPLTFTVSNTGLTFQLNERALPTDRLEVGIRGINTNTLGFDSFRDYIAEAEGAQAAQVTKGGFLNSIRTGQGNDLFQDPENAQAIVEQAITQVASLRGFLGAVQADALEPNIDSLGVAVENLSASLADLRDLDFAEETANFTKNQILFQSGIAVLASANLIPQSILTLLG
jgi:flagellin